MAITRLVDGKYIMNRFIFNLLEIIPMSCFPFMVDEDDGTVIILVARTVRINLGNAGYNIGCHLWIPVSIRFMVT